MSCTVHTGVSLRARGSDLAAVKRPPPSPSVPCYATNIKYHMSCIMLKYYTYKAVIFPPPPPYSRFYATNVKYRLHSVYTKISYKVCTKRLLYHQFRKRKIDFSPLIGNDPSLIIFVIKGSLDLF